MSRKLARDITENKVKKGYDFKSHISTKISFEEQMYRALLSEYDFGEKFGLKVNEQILDYGDGGRDFEIELYVDGVKRVYWVNVKVKRVKVSWEALSQHPTHLRVPVRECKKLTIYVFATYDERTDTAVVRRWAWGDALIKHKDIRTFENSDGTENYVLPFEQLRELDDLKARMRPPAPAPAKQQWRGKQQPWTGKPCAVCGKTNGYFDRATYEGAPDGGVTVHRDCLAQFFENLEREQWKHEVANAILQAKV